ncbi:MAG: hypothetical protein IKD09_02325 [Lentisphaeria bacterium]|nr:hypothetical protein [Lentisphaeria bacterium]
MKLYQEGEFDKFPDNGCFENSNFIGVSTPDALLLIQKNDGVLSHIIDKKNRINLINSDKKNDLFQLLLTLQENNSNNSKKLIAAGEFQKRTYEIESATAFNINFSGHAEVNINIKIRIFVDSDGLFHLQFEGDNYENAAIEEISFLKLSVPKNFNANNNSDDGHVMLPVLCGEILIDEPWSQNYSADSMYPRSMDVQFMNIYTSQTGLYAATYDGEYNYKKFTVSLQKNQDFSLEIRHLLPDVISQKISIPYDTVIGVFSGDWMTAADIYKKWAINQKWCEKKLSERKNLPIQFTEGVAVLATPFLHEYNLKIYNLYDYSLIDKYPEIADRYKKLSGLPHICFVPVGWENRGAWAGNNYFPARPSNEKWIEISEKLQHQGDMLFMMPSGFKWVIKRQGNPHQGEAFDDTEDFENRKEMMIFNSDGQPYFQDMYHDAGCYIGLTAKMCYSSPQAQQTVLDIFKKIADLGVTIVQFDQEDGGAQDIPCYNPAHPHKKGYTNEYSKDFLTLCRQILAECQKINPNFGLSIEQCGEAVIPTSAVMWARQCSEVNEQVNNCRSIAAFPYIYHEYQMVLGDGFSVGQGMWATCGSYELRCFRLANALARGLIPTVYMEQVALDAEDEWTQKVSQAFVTFCRPFAKFQEYLLRGITQRPLVIQCDNQKVWHYMVSDDGSGELLSDGRMAKKVFITRPTCVIGSFKQQDNSLGSVIINSTFSEQNVKISLPENFAVAELYNADRELLKKWEINDPNLSLDLKALEVNFLILR